MDERHSGQYTGDHDERDADEPLARDDSTWFARQLGAEWQPDEPGIYRYVGPQGRPGMPDEGDVVTHGRSNGRHDAGTHSRRWPPWRRD